MHAYVQSTVRVRTPNWSALDVEARTEMNHVYSMQLYDHVVPYRHSDLSGN